MSDLVLKLMRYVSKFKGKPGIQGEQGETGQDGSVVSYDLLLVLLYG